MDTIDTLPKYRYYIDTYFLRYFPSLFFKEEPKNYHQQPTSALPGDVSITFFFVFASYLRNYWSVNEFLEIKIVLFEIYYKEGATEFFVTLTGTEL